MWWMATGAMGVLSALNDKDKAEQAAWAQKNQIEWNNHLGKLDMDRKNREIAGANAAQWMANQEITKGAYQQQAEEKVYLRHRIDNELGAFSRNASSQTAMLDMTLEGRNIKGGTARALLNSANSAQSRIMEDQMVSFSNAARDTKRRRNKALAQRNFGYNGYASFIGTDSSHIDPMAAGKDALTSGLIAAGATAIGTAMEQSHQDKLDSFREDQLTHMKSQYKPGGLLGKVGIKEPEWKYQTGGGLMDSLMQGLGNFGSWFDEVLG